MSPLIKQTYNQLKYNIKTPQPIAPPSTRRRNNRQKLVKPLRLRFLKHIRPASLGDSAIGIYSTLHYASPIKSPMNDAFVKAYFARVKHQPSDNAPDGWVGAKAFGDAAAAVGGNVENAPKFIEALKAVKFDSPKGPIALDKYGQVIQSMYVRQTEKAGDGYVNSVVATYPNIDQFWPLTFEQYESYKYRYAELKGSLTDCAKVLEKK